MENVKTGHVNEKKNFWMMRSQSTDRVNKHEMSPGPQRRRRLGDWMRSEQTPEPCSRPGTSVGQAAAQATGNVKATISNWGTLSKSRSSAAVMLTDSQNNNRVERPRSRLMDNWAGLDNMESRDKSVERIDAHHSTQQVHETVSSWENKKEGGSCSGRNTPVPTRIIGETFADSKIQQDELVAVKQDGPTPWRTKTPEPGLKLLNVKLDSNK